MRAPLSNGDRLHVLGRVVLIKLKGKILGFADFALCEPERFCETDLPVVGKGGVS
jgi:hypothetical protein